MECMRAYFHKDQLLDGRFRTIAPLNHGSFGMVFLAEDTLTKQEVAIKCLTKPNATDSTNAVPFDEGAEELACHAILKFHPHLVNLVHHFDTASHTYLVLEYCSQGDLYEAIRNERGPLETEHVRRFMLQLISAVEHMHQHGLYHRDIKPENIFLTQDGSVKLGDFGLATRSLWSYEACVGSDRYMAPEQYDPAGNGYSPAKADLWSIGICLLNVLFSRNPFVTPTDSDILFADYRRDRQSLFDIFPNMTQDTFEVLSFVMSMDPLKRDLGGFRDAILRAVSFTTDNENMDDFCTEERDVVRASANREPLRTPSIQSPQMDGEAFPWAKALHTSPPQRQLSVIRDDDMYDEDLFPPSEKGLNLGESWYSAKQNTPSMASVLESAFGSSFKSMAIRRPTRGPPRPDPISIPSSLPVPAPRVVPSMSQVFGKKDTVAKSWSDMWEEDEEEMEREDAALQERTANNMRSWSHESTRKPTPVSSVLREKKSCSALNIRPSPKMHSVVPKQNGSGSPNENDPNGWRLRSPKRSPKQVPSDKWAALGDRRRNPQAKAETTTVNSTKKRSMTTTSRKRSGSSSQENLGYNRRDSRSKAHPVHFDNDWRQHKSVDSSPDDAEWVGGWHNFHL